MNRCFFKHLFFASWQIKDPGGSRLERGGGVIMEVLVPQQLTSSFLFQTDFFPQCFISSLDKANWEWLLSTTGEITLPFSEKQYNNKQ